MFLRLPDIVREDETVTFLFEGQPVAARTSDSVAAALLLAGIGATRTTPLSGASRAPYCNMGVCFECLMVIDGVAEQQACMVRARDGMVVSRQHGPAGIIK